MILEWITEPLEYAFMQKAFLGIILAGINCSIIGVYVVLRRMSFVGEALTHTLLPGIVFAYLKGIHLFWGALCASLVTSYGIGFLTSRKTVRQDSAIGVILTFMFALGILMMSSAKSFKDFSSILFGSILGVTTGDLMLTGSITILVLGIIILLYKELELSSFDTNYSKLIRIRPNKLRYVILFLIALSVVSAVQMMGALLTTALLITPAATAGLICQRLSRLIMTSSIIATFSGIAGLYTSYHFEVSAGASIVICCFACFLAVSLYKAIPYRK